MAIFSSFLLGNVKKSVANLTMYVSRGVNIVRSKPLNVHNPRTPKQRMQRAKMAMLIHLASSFGPVLGLGYPEVKGLVSSNNRFVQDNMFAVTVDSFFIGTVDYSMLACSSGHLKAPRVAVSYDESGKQLVFTQSVQKKTYTSSPNDVAWGVAYEKVQHETEIYELKSREEGGEVKVDMPEDWKIANCEFYTFVRNSNGSLASNTSYLQLTTV